MSKGKYYDGNKTRRDLTERMQKLFNLYMACDDVVRNSNKTYQKEESIRSIVTTIFLQATKGISYGC